MSIYNIGFYEDLTKISFYYHHICSFYEDFMKISQKLSFTNHYIRILSLLLKIITWKATGSATIKIMQHSRQIFS